MENVPTRPSTVRSSGTKPTPAFEDVLDAAAHSSSPSSTDGAGDVVLQAEDGLGQFRLAVALHAGDGEDLAAGDVEAESVHDVLAGGPIDREVL